MPKILGKKVPAGLSPSRKKKLLTGQTGGNNVKKSVFVGLSGGVDSSVAAALLKKAGYQVTGVFIRVWQPEWLSCTWRDDRRDAMRVAAKLNIPFLTLTLEKEYKKGVIDYMIREYKAGRTPNPDVLCNKEIKFGAFFKKAQKMGADYIATGHYARIGHNGKHLAFSKNKDFQIPNSTHYTLHTARDKGKDQSYFLWNLTPEILAKVFFPVGGIKKEEVRKLAKKFNLPTSEKKDSQGLCFVGDLDMKEFLGRYIKQKKGSVLNEKGEKIGWHNGAQSFTLGERHGFHINNKTPNNTPFYVIDKNIAKNTITVGIKEKIKTKFSGKNITISNTNWIKIPRVGQKILVAPRYHGELVFATVLKVYGKKTEFKLNQTNQPFTPGQSLVLYNHGEVLGGGVIN